MNEYIILSNDFYEISINEDYEKFGNDVIKYSTLKMNEYLKFFKENKFPNKIKISFFDNREDFLSKIKELGGKIPPEWATGSYYGGEIQILLDKNDLNKKYNTIAHETFHLLFKKFVREKYNIERIVWLDEALAANFSGEVERDLQNGNFLYYLKNCLKEKNIPVINEYIHDNTKTKQYDYFYIIGQYLRETMSNDELLEFMKNNDSVLKRGDTIIKDSLEYFKNKYKMVVNNEEVNYKIKK